MNMKHEAEKIRHLLIITTKYIKLYSSTLTAKLKESYLTKQKNISSIERYYQAASVRSSQRL